MTVSTDTRRVQYATNGTTGPFTVTFPFLENSHLAVTYTDSAGTDTLLTLNVDYTVSGEEVTTTLAYASGGVITIDRDIPITQELDLRDGDDFPPEAVEEALDKLTMVAQQVSIDAVRVLRVPEVSANIPLLPSVADRASKMLGFDANGDPTVFVPSSGSAADVLIQLANAASAVQGDALIGVKRTLTGATATTQHIVNEARPVNVQSDFGAVADGVTSNTTVVQTACDSLSNGGLVVIPPNVVWTRSGVTIPANVAVLDLASTSKTLYTASNFYRFANLGLTIGAPTTGTRIFATNSVDGTEYLVFGLDTGANPATYICAGGGGSVAFTDSSNNTKASINVNNAATNNPGFLAGFSAPNKGGFSANGDSSLGNGLGMRLQDTRTTGGDWDFFVDVSGGEARYGLFEADSGVTLFEMTPTLVKFNLPVSSLGSRQRGKAVVNNNGSASYTVTSTVSYVAFTGTNVGTLAFTFPAASSAIDGHEVAIYTQNAVGTSATWASTGATFVGAPATLAAGSVTRFIYHHATTQWLPR